MMEKHESITYKNNHIEIDDNSEIYILKDDDDDDEFYQQEPIPPQNPVIIELVSNNQAFSDKTLVEKNHKDLQLIYIIAYCNYRKHFQAIAQTYNCQIHFIKNTYLIYCQDQSNSKAFTQCTKHVQQQVNKVTYSKIDSEKKFHILNSPYYNKQANEKGIYFCLFNKQVLIYTNCLTNNELQDEKKRINMNCNIYPVKFLRKRYFQAMDGFVAKYYQKILNQYYREKFEINNIIIEVNTKRNYIYITGKPGTNPYQMMEAKSFVKGVIQSLVGVAFKNTVLTVRQEDKLMEYLQKKSKYPIICAKICDNITALLSKDSIILQLLKRKQQIKKKVGIVQKTLIGIYIPSCYTKEDKQHQVYKICREESYDNIFQWGIRYFRPMISSQGEKLNLEQIIDLVMKIVNGFMEVKQKYQIEKKKNQKTTNIEKQKKKQLQEQNKYAYQVKNSNNDSKELENILKRDVLEDQIFMKNRYNVIYNILQGKQLGPFYIPRIEYDKGVIKGTIKLYRIEDLQKGEYLQTYLKIWQPQNDHLIENLEKLLIEELKGLKIMAGKEKQTHFNLDNNRKIAHMIKKLIIVL